MKTTNNHHTRKGVGVMVKQTKQFRHGIVCAEKNGWHQSRYGDFDYKIQEPTVYFRTYHTSLWLKISQVNDRTIATMFLSLPEHNIYLEALQVIEDKDWCAVGFYNRSKEKIFNRVSIKLEENNGMEENN